MASELRVDKIIPSSGASIGIGTTNGTTTVVNNLSVGSSVTASAFYGDGSGLTGAGPTLSSGSNDRVITATGANALKGESALTFDGATLDIDGGTTDTPLMIDTANNNGAHLRFRKDGSNQHFVGSGGGFSLGDKEDLSFRAYDNLLFATGNSSTERMRIDSSGNVTKPSQAMFSAAGSGNAWVIFNSGSGWYNLGDSSFDGSSYYRDHGWTTTGRPGVGVRGVTSSGASVWDNAKGRFTAPVNGFYFFEINLYIRAYSGGYTFHVNPWIGSTNTDYYTSNIGIIRNSSNSVTGNTQQYPNSVMRSIVLYLTANQQFRWSVYAENDHFESYKSQAHQSGYLIG